MIICINNKQTHYDVDVDGNIKNLKTNKLLTPEITHKGYLRVQIFHKGKKYRKLVHRLVMETFYPDADFSLQVNHKDGNKRNNKLSNLEWCTQKENMRHSFDNGLHKIKYTKSQNIEICELLANTNMSICEIAIKCNVPQGKVQRILDRTDTTHISKHYNFSNRKSYGKFKYFNSTLRNDIESLLRSHYKPKDICNILNIPYNNSIRQSIINIRNNLDKSSTTNDMGDKYYYININLSEEDKLKYNKL